MIEEAKALLSEKDVFAAIESLASETDPLAVLEAYHNLVRQLYYEARDVPAMIAMALAGVEYGLSQASRVQRDEPAIASELRGRAKGLAYNLAANTWPGWDEPGVELDSTAMAIGLQAAQANLRLAQELDKGDLALSRAFWMLGGHYLAGGDLALAQEAYGEAGAHASLAGQDAESLLAAGFSLIVQLVAGATDATRPAGETQEELARLRESLASLENGEFFVQQIDTALRVFAEN